LRAVLKSSPKDSRGEGFKDSSEIPTSYQNFKVWQRSSNKKITLQQPKRIKGTRPTVKKAGSFCSPLKHLNKNMVRERIYELLRGQFF
jgi:hypothetical protein